MTMFKVKVVCSGLKQKYLVSIPSTSFSAVHSPCSVHFCILSSRHSVYTNVSGDNCVITHVNSRRFGLVDISQRELERDMMAEEARGAVSLSSDVYKRLLLEDIPSQLNPLYRYGLPFLSDPFQ